MTETVASYSVPEHHVKQYTSNVMAALVKMPAELMATVTVASYVGEKSQVVNFIGPVEFTRRDTPYGDTKVSQLEHTQRWINGHEYDCAVLIDRLDMLKMIYDPTSPYVERMREGAARKQDEIIMSTFFAAAKTGKDGVTSTAYKSANTVAHGNAGMTIAKLRSLRKLMKKRHISLKRYKPYIGVTADEVDDLLGETQAVSSDYNAIKPLVDGEISGFMGFQFVPYEDTGDNEDGKSIPRTAGGSDVTRDLPCWVQDGMHYGSWSGLNIIIGPRADKNNIKQAHATFTGGATRLQEDKVFAMETYRAS